MFGLLRRTLWLLSMSLTGCATTVLTAHLPGFQPGEGPALTRAFRLDDSVELQSTLADLNHETMTREMARTRPGSLVHISDTADRRFVGTLVSSERGGLVLMNCIGKDVVVDADGQKQLRTSHLPFLAIETDSMTNFRVMAAPSRNWRADDPRGYTAAAVVLKSGRRLACPPLSLSDSARRSSSALHDDLFGHLAAIPVGSRVAVIDDSGQWFQATLSGKGPSDIELMNCLTCETVLGPWGQDQIQVVHLPFRSLQISSLVACERVTSSPEDSVVTNPGENCQEYIVEGFLLNNGSYQSWEQSSEPVVATQERASREIPSSR